mmetsp:Transcript_48428/g.122172  ORF Transcript_48428/g.122172 Transcript_48428/m.122172 type:complete len:221 (-) Transcript_48428:239-901(-)
MQMRRCPAGSQTASCHARGIDEVPGPTVVAQPAASVTAAVMAAVTAETTTTAASASLPRAAAAPGGARNRRRQPCHHNRPQRLRLRQRPQALRRHQVQPGHRLHAGHPMPAASLAPRPLPPRGHKASSSTLLCASAVSARLPGAGATGNSGSSEWVSWQTPARRRPRASPRQGPSWPPRAANHCFPLAGTNLHARLAPRTTALQHSCVEQKRPRRKPYHV